MTPHPVSDRSVSAAPAIRLLWVAALLAGSLSTPTPVEAGVRLPQVFADHMVLQRGRPIPIWGWAAPDADVSVSLAGQTGTAKADAVGRFRVDLPALEAGGPHELVVSADDTLKRTDVMVGDVWLCIGQSNMQWKLSQAATAGRDVPGSTDERLRLCMVPTMVATAPQDDVAAVWAVSGPGSAAGFSAVAWHFGRELRSRLDVPVGVMQIAAGAIPIESFLSPEGCAQEPSQASFPRIAAQVRTDLRRIRERAIEESVSAWRVQVLKAIEDDRPLPGWTPPAVPDAIAQRGWMPLGLYHGAVHPLIPYGLRGLALYQGEANNGQGLEYLAKLRALIAGYRGLWGDASLPVLFVQLAPWAKYPPGNVEGIWEAQRLALDIPRTAMVVTTDLVPDLNDIHPNRKQEVGQRLALAALATAYGRADVVSSGPLVRDTAVKGDSIRVTFDHVGSGLAARDGKPLDSFEVGTAAGFVPARAEVDGQTVVVRADDVPHPEFVRFGWRNTAQPNLINKEGLPASPFRTDLPAPVFTGATRFAREGIVTFVPDAATGAQRPGLGSLIRVTLDGSTPSATSPAYTDPLRLTETTTVTARRFSADGRSSLPVRATFTSVEPIMVDGRPLSPGVDHEFFPGRWVTMPPFAELQDAQRDVRDTLVTPVRSESFMAAHRIRGFIVLPTAGRYTFRLTEQGRPLPPAQGRGRLTIDGAVVAGAGRTSSSDSTRQPAALATGRTVRVRLEGKEKIVSLAEVQVIEAGTGVELQKTGTAAQSSTGFSCVAARASDGNANSSFFAGSITTTEAEENPWWKVDFGSERAIGRLVVYNRGDCCGDRLSGAIVEVLDAAGAVAWKSRIGTVDSGSVDEFDAADAVSLPAGARPFVLEYLEGMGPPTLEVMVEGPGVERQRVPATMLWRRPG